MNHKFIKLDDNKYIVSDTEGNINLVKSNNDKSIKKILTKENELEELQTISKKIHTNLILLKFNERKRKVITRFTNITMGLFLLLSIFFANSFIPTIIISYGILESLKLVMYGTKKRNNTEIIDAHRAYFECNQKIANVKDELQKLMKENKFKKHDQDINVVITPMIRLNEETNYKIKKLVPNKDQ